MGWTLINSVVRKSYGDHPESNYSFGYLVGDGHEDGYFCFSESPYFNKPFISDTFLPRIQVGWDSLPMDGLCYNDERVFGGPSLVSFVFKPKTQSGDWIYATFLREPYYYTDIDETTVVGDQFYKGELPEVNGDPEEWEIAGAYSQNEAGSTKEVTLTQNVWLWQNNGSMSQSASGFAGRYYNSEDGSWKYVGVPTYKATNDSYTDAYYRTEEFSRSAEKDNHGNFQFEGTEGHIIKNVGGTTWVLGRQGVGKWSIAESNPSMDTPVQFRGYQIDEGTTQAVPDPKGDFIFEWKCCRMGNGTKEVLMGEVSLWRKAQATL